LAKNWRMLRRLRMASWISMSAPLFSTPFYSKGTIQHFDSGIDKQNQA